MPWKSSTLEKKSFSGGSRVTIPGFEEPLVWLSAARAVIVRLQIAKNKAAVGIKQNFLMTSKKHRLLLARVDSDNFFAR
jgi:hypothetical protein